MHFLEFQIIRPERSRRTRPKVVPTFAADAGGCYTSKAKFRSLLVTGDSKELMPNGQ